MKIVVTGDLGYVGTHLTPLLVAAGHNVTGFDICRNLAEDIRITPVTLPPCDAAVHLAGLIDARASVADPFAYYVANVTGTLNVLAAMQRVDCHYLVTASTAAAADPASSPYAASKRVIENILPTLDAAYPISYLAFRLHNVAGGHEQHVPETHLIPKAVAAARSGEPLPVYGTGTSERDYVHVLDVCEAIVAALRILPHYHLNGVIDIGTGIGTKTRDVIAAVGTAVGRPVPTVVAEGPSESASLIAGPAHAKVLLDWKPRRTLADIIAEAVAQPAEVTRA